MKNSLLRSKLHAKLLYVALAWIVGLGFISSAQAQIEPGTYSVGDGGDWANLTAAFDQIKADSATGDIVLELLGGYTDTDLSISGVGFDSATITIRPHADALFALFEGRTHFTGGSRNVIFDGRPGGTGDAFPDGNALMIFRQDDSSDGNGAIHQQGAGSLSILFAEVRSDARYGILSLFSMGSNSALGAPTLTVEGCRVTSFQTGYANTTAEGETYNTEAIRTLFTDGDVVIRGNTIEDWKAAPGEEVGGLFMLHANGNLAAGPSVKWTVVNNHITIEKPTEQAFVYGIRLNTSNGWTRADNVYEVLHNTIVVTGSNSSTAENAVTCAFGRQANAAHPPHQMILKNNIFENRVTNEGGATASHAAVWIRDDGGDVLQNSDIDFNNYSSTGGVFVTYGNPSAGATSYDGLADWTASVPDTIPGRDVNTTIENPVFTDFDNGDLSLDVPEDGSETWYVGTALGIGFDIKGNARKASVPSKGAYEVILPGLPAGVYSIAADPSNPGTADYASLEDAFADIELKGLEGEVFLELESGYTATNLTLSGSGVEEFPTTIRPASGSAFALFSGRTHVTGGAENIIFDGRPAGTEDAFPNGNAVMIFRQEDNSNGNGAIHHQGAGALTVKYAEVRSDARYGIFSQFANGITVENCRISSFQSGFANNTGEDETYNTEAFRALFAVGDVTLRNNTIDGWLAAPGEEMGGIFILHIFNGGEPNTWTLVNNQIILEKPTETAFVYGIRLNTSNGWTREGNKYEVLNNTIVVKGTNSSTLPIALTCALGRQANAVHPEHTMVVKNNIFDNQVTNEEGATASHVALWIRDDGQDVLGKSDIDFNNYSSASGGLVAYGNPSADITAYTDLSAWSGASGDLDASTTVVTPAFVSIDNGNLALNPDSITVDDTWYIGTPLEGVTTDITGGSRSGTEPTKGAYELNPGALGLEDLLDVSNSLIVYPNPVSRQTVNLSMDNELTGNIRIEVLGTDGRLFRSFDFEKRSASFQQELPLEGIPSGLFFITVTGKDHRAVKRLLKL